MTDEKVSGKELQLVLSGARPMAVFYRAVSEMHDEKDGQNFDNYVKEGQLTRSRFYIQNEGQRFKLMYVTYCRKGEEWRAELYKCIKKIGQEVWNDRLEQLEGWLLGCQTEIHRPDRYSIAKVEGFGEAGAAVGMDELADPGPADRYNTPTPHRRCSP